MLSRYGIVVVQLEQGRREHRVKRLSATFQVLHLDINGCQQGGISRLCRQPRALAGRWSTVSSSQPSKLFGLEAHHENEAVVWTARNPETRGLVISERWKEGKSPAS